MRKAINGDSNTKGFKYPFDDKEVIEELERHIYLVPFPSKNFMVILIELLFLYIL